MSDRVVFDAEPLVAHVLDETGAGRVEEYLDLVDEGDAEGFVSPVTLTEVLYVSRRAEDTPELDTFLGWLQSRLGIVKPSACWRSASRYKKEYQVSLGDAYALASAEYVGGTLLVGGDDDFDGIDEVDTERFREDAA